MAREAFSEHGLPSREVREQILQRAGVILDEARDLVARLDYHETFVFGLQDQHRTAVRPLMDDQISVPPPTLGDSNVLGATIQVPIPPDKSLAA